MVKLQWETALVTGGSRGIGRGIAFKLVENGIRKIAINYVENDATAKDTLNKLQDRGAEGILIKGDVGKTEFVKAMFEQVKSKFGGLDIFVHNARNPVGQFYQPPMEASVEGLQAAYDSQAKCMLLGCQESAKLMHTGGRIIAITYAPGSRTGSWQPWVNMGAAKAALESTVRYFAVALARKGITVNSVSPGATDDSVLNGLPAEIFKAIKDWNISGWTPTGRMGTPADIGNAVSLLCASEANWITGQTIHADGGSSLMNSDFPLPIQGL